MRIRFRCAGCERYIGYSDMKGLRAFYEHDPWAMEPPEVYREPLYFHKSCDPRTKAEFPSPTGTPAEKE